MGLERVERLEKDYEVDLEWKAFELKPGIPPEGIPRPFKEGETAELRGHMKEAAEAAGLVRMRRQQLTPNSRPSLEAAVYAGDQGRVQQYNRAVFKAFWDEGKDIGDAGVLQEVFQECGLDWEDFNRPEGNGQYAQRVDTELAEARMYGISGVPAFILDRYLISGAQPYEVFQQAMELIRKEKATKGLWTPGQDAG